MFYVYLGSLDALWDSYTYFGYTEKSEPLLFKDSAFQQETEI